MTAVEQDRAIYDPVGLITDLVATAARAWHPTGFIRSSSPSLEGGRNRGGWPPPWPGAPVSCSTDDPQRPAQSVSCWGRCALLGRE
jgi:hypothetical protein